MKKALLVLVVVIGIVFVLAGTSFAEKGGQGKGSSVSKAVHQAQSEGLKGKDIAGAAHEAIEERKEGKEEDMEEKKEEKGEKHKEKHSKRHKNHKGKKDIEKN